MSVMGLTWVNINGRRVDSSYDKRKRRGQRKRWEVNHLATDILKDFKLSYHAHCDRSTHRWAPSNSHPQCLYGLCEANAAGQSQSDHVHLRNAENLQMKAWADILFSLIASSLAALRSVAAQQNSKISFRDTLPVTAQTSNTKKYGLLKEGEKRKDCSHPGTNAVIMPVLIVACLGSDSKFELCSNSQQNALMRAECDDRLRIHTITTMVVDGHYWDSV